MTQLKHPFVKKFALKLADKARAKFTDDHLRTALFHIAAIYGCTELYGLWETCKMVYHLMIKPIFIGRRK